MFAWCQAPASRIVIDQDRSARASPDFDADALQQEYLHAGLPPLLHAADGSQEQARWIARQIVQSARQLRLPVNAAAVLVSSSIVGEPLAEALTGYRLAARFMSSSQFDLAEPCIKVTTLHAAKGLEFPIVVVAHVEAGRLPRETVDAPATPLPCQQSQIDPYYG